jgi:fatty-acyl-CoA synthase
VSDGLVSAFDAMGADAPLATAIVAGGRAVTWDAFTDRARRVAWHLASEVRLGAGDRVAIALGCDAELLEVLYATLMLGCVPVVLSAELGVDATYAVVDRSDAKVLVHLPQRAKPVRTAVKRIPKPWRPVLLERGARYEQVVAGAPPAREWQPDRSNAEGLLLVAVGAREPGAMLVWSDRELVVALRGSLDPHLRGARVLSVAPLTHTLGLFTALRTLLARGTTVLVEVEPLDAGVIWDATVRDEVEVLSIGSAAALHTLTKALSDEPERWKPGRLRAIVSPVRCDAVTRRVIASALPAAELREPGDAPRRVGDRVRVIDLATGRDVVAGSGAIGTVVVGGAVPLGYHDDPERTGASFCSIGGTRYGITGERATVDAGGTIHPVVDPTPVDDVDLRTSLVEIEAKLRTHPSVAECVVVRVAAEEPVARTQVVALVQVRTGHHLDEPELTAWCRSRLRRFEPPDRFLFVDRLTPEDCDPDDREHVRRWATELLA